MVSSKQDVVVVGGSVAGLFAAYRLAQAGVRVRVLEKQQEWSPEARTLIVTPTWLRMLDFDVDAAVLNRTRVFELISRTASARVELREPDVVLERARFVRLLAQQVAEAGGEVLLGHRFHGLEQRDSLPMVRFVNGCGTEATLASTVIGADGVGSGVAHEVARDDQELVSIWQARVRLPADLAPHTVRCWFDRKSTRFFYWLIPESPDTGVVGLIADSEEEAEGALRRFTVAEGLEPLAYQAARVPLFNLGGQLRVQFGQGEALLVGDAAGQVKVTTVGGVVTGMRGGAAAARSIIHRTSYGAEARGLRRELQAHAGLRYMLDGFEDADYDRLLRSLNRRTQRVFQCYSRDELGRSLWRLMLANPRWVKLGARGFLRALGRGCHISRGRAGRRDSTGRL